MTRFRTAHVGTAFGERLLNERKKRAGALLLDEFFEFTRFPVSGVISPRGVLLGPLISMARQNREYVPSEGLKLAFLVFMVLMGQQGSLDLRVEGGGRLRDRGTHIVRVDRDVIFFGIVVRHTGELLMTPVP